MKTFNFAVSDADVTKMIAAVIVSEATGDAGRSTYLRSLAASIQVELGGKPLTAPPRGRVKRIDPEEALAALTTVNARFYALVLTAIDGKELDAKTRNAKSGFARSAASTLRSALKWGLNPLSIVIPDVTKESLRSWTAEHRPPPVVDTAAGIKRARALIRQLSEFIEPLTDRDKTVVMAQFHSELDGLDAVVNYVPPGDPHRRTHIIPTAGARQERRAIT